jgi:hypothetical protein
MHADGVGSEDIDLKPITHIPRLMGINPKPTEYTQEDKRMGSAYAVVRTCDNEIKRSEKVCLGQLILDYRPAERHVAPAYPGLVDTRSS